jgi:hypothetical protein
MALEMTSCPPLKEDLMTPRNPVASRGAVFVAAVAVVAIGFAASPADAQTPAPSQKSAAVPKALKRQYDNRGRLYYGQSGPNVSYQDGPHTRVYITKRSWLDAGTEVLPGDRKFADYAYPPEVSFARQNNNRPIDRQPLNPPSDFGGSEGSYAWRWPFYWDSGP